MAAIAKHARYSLIALCLTLVPMSSAWAKGLLRDAEIEATLRNMANPIFETADIRPADDVKIFIVDDESINAFVAGGLNLFLHSGLIKATKTPEMLYGVIAHETGHIAGAHLSKLRDISRRGTIGSIIGAIVGVGAIAASNGTAGAGVLAGTQSMAMRSMLSDIRVNEQSADHAALGYLDQLGISAMGMQDMFAVLRRNERGRNNDPYLLSHPLSKDRVSMVRSHVMQSSISQDALSPEITLAYQRMRARLIAYTESYTSVLRHFPASDTSFAARYARAIALYRNRRMEESLKELDALEKESADDAFLHDTRGQICFEYGKLDCAKNAYQKAHALLPESGLIMSDYAKTLLQQPGKPQISLAIDLLEQATTQDGTLSYAWRLLATAYGEQKRMGESYYALAQENAATGSYVLAKNFVKKAIPLLKPGSPHYLKAQDLEKEATREIKRAREEGSLF